MASRYYTPWMAQAGRQIGSALETRGVRAQKEQQNKLIQSAYMGDPQAMQSLMQVNPQMGMKVQEDVRKRKDKTDQAALSKRTAFSKETKEIMTNIARFDTFEEAQEYGDRMTQDIASRYPEIIQSVGADAVFDEGDFNQAKQIYGAAQDGSISRDVETHQYLIDTINNPDSLDHEVRAAKIKLKLDPGAAQTIEYKQQLSDMGVDASGQKNLDKLKQEREWKPRIESAVTEARKIAQKKGEIFTDLKQMEAALPGLYESIGELKELADISTSTIAGRAWDSIVKETGFGSTEGATAAVKWTAIVMNQVLPLLRETFGAAFTQEEGKKLEAAMGDVNADPVQKLAQLDAFIAQKERNVRAKEIELKGLGGDDQTKQVLSDEDLLKKYGG